MICNPIHKCMNTHYIKIVISKNGTKILKEKYPRQLSSEINSYLYAESAEEIDLITAPPGIFVLSVNRLLQTRWCLREQHRISRCSVLLLFWGIFAFPVHILHLG